MEGERERERESWLLYFNYIPVIVWLPVFFVSSWEFLGLLVYDCDIFCLD